MGKGDEGMSKAPDLSGLAGAYAASRPGYPSELYAWLAAGSADLIVAAPALPWFDLARSYEDPVVALAPLLEDDSGSEGSVREVRWPLYLRASVL